jgi:hypothetical protein
MGTAVRTAKTSPASWDAFADVDVFVDEVLTELAAMEADGTKPTLTTPKVPKVSCRCSANSLATAVLNPTETESRL